MRCDDGGLIEGGKKKNERELMQTRSLVLFLLAIQMATNRNEIYSFC